MLSRFLIGSLTLLAACAQAPSIEEGPIGRSLSLAAAEANVPRDLVVAIAATEGGLGLAAQRFYDAEDHVLVAGRLELRHGGFDSLARGAEITGASEQVLVEDTELGTRAGVVVLADLGRELAAGDDLSSWAPALEKLSGHADGAQRRDYARRVLARIADGGSFVAYGGEQVAIAAHPQLLLPGVALQALGGTPEFAGATWFDTSCNNKCNIGRGGAVVDTIVIHDTEGGWDASVATLQNDSGKSVHYIIDADGSRVGQFRPESDITWHSGNSVYNGRSVGIEHVGYTGDANGYAPALYAKSVALVQSIRTRHSIPLDRTHIIGHYQVPNGNAIGSSADPCTAALMSCETSANYGGANNHRDPGPHWMWCQYMESLGGSCTCNDAFAHFNCTTDKTEAVRCNNGAVEIKHCASACVVQPTGVDDLCSTVANPSRRDPRAEAALGTLHETPAAPIDSTGDTPPVNASGCSIATRRAASANGAIFVIFAVGALLLARRRRRVR